MSEIDIEDTGLPMARIAALAVVGPASLELTWADGERAGRTETVDLSPALYSYKIYRPLRNDPALFATAHLIEDGDAVAWVGQELEMSADVIETLADQSMTPSEFAEFLKRNGLTQEEAARLLGRSRRQIGYYLSPGPVPRIVALACLGYEAVRRRGQRAA